MLKIKLSNSNFLHVSTGESSQGSPCTASAVGLKYQMQVSVNAPKSQKQASRCICVPIQNQPQAYELLAER